MRRSLRHLGPLERRQALEAALVRMMAAPESRRPFVILEHRASGQFVQFAGSQTKALLFDVPALGKSEVLGLASDARIYDQAVSLAFATLAALVYRMPPTEAEDAIGRHGSLVLDESLDSDSDNDEARRKAS